MKEPQANHDDYRAAYERQKLAREKAEGLLESRSSELRETHQSLMQAYNKLKDQKEQIFHQEKLASIGQLAAGVAHEINNPAGYVKGNLVTLKNYSQNILRALAALEALAQDNPHLQAPIKKIHEDFDIEYIFTDLSDVVEESLEGIVRIEDIVKSLKNFARAEQAEPVVFDINECVEDTLKLVHKEISQKATLEKHLDAKQKIRGQPGNLSQVILNLMVNAVHAITDHGTIRITTEDKDNEVILRVEDTGCGIDQNHLKKIFDPFFTTKGIGAGTGLGLSVSHGIIQKHQGRMHVTSKHGEGSTFSCFLPSARD